VFIPHLILQHREVFLKTHKKIQTKNAKGPQANRKSREAGYENQAEVKLNPESCPRVFPGQIEVQLG
jgi:hypothetical protein